MKKIFIIIPAYNEEKNISTVIKHTLKYSKNIIVVDDGSEDKTFERAKAMKVMAVKHVANLGKGAALKTGAELALREHADILVFIDADKQHEPKEIPFFLERLYEADVIFGSRRRTKKMPLRFRFGNSILTHLTKFLFGVKLHDTQSGYRAMTSEAYKKIRWRSMDYSVETEMIANVGKKRLKYDEIFIKTIYDDKHKGTTPFHGLKIALDMLWWRLRG